MWQAFAWISVGVLASLIGALALTQDDDALQLSGWVLIAVGGLFEAIGIIAAGVLIALREHARPSR